MERVYYIDHVSNDDINALSLKLNSMQEVSHIKINKDSISFNCARPDNIQNYLDESKMDYVLQEMVNRKKREYVSNQAKVEKIFMFTNLESEEDAHEIQNILSKYSVYENVQLDFQNKLLTLTTSAKALPRISRIVENVNPEIQVEQWKKPFKSKICTKVCKNCFIMCRYCTWIGYFWRYFIFNLCGMDDSFTYL